MNYSKNLLAERKKSKFALILGLTSIVLAITLISLNLITKTPFSTFTWIYTLIFLLNGVSHTMHGLGYSIERAFGTAYIRIDPSAIEIKTSVWTQAQKLDWDKIAAIEYRSGFFYITQKDHATQKLIISKLDYATIQEVKNIIVEIAQDKKIAVKL